MNWCWFSKNEGYAPHIEFCNNYPYYLSIRNYNPTLKEFSNNTWTLGCDTSNMQLRMWESKLKTGILKNFWGNTDRYMVGAGGSDNFGYLQKDKKTIAVVNLGVSPTYIYEISRTYLQGKIQVPLERGCRYKFKCYLKLAPSYKGLFYSTTAFGVAFINNPVFYQNYKELIVNHQPDIENPPTRWLRDSTDYMMVSGEFVAKGGEQYLLLGNFKSYEDTPITPEPVKDDLGDYWPLQLPYFLDDLSLVAMVPDHLKLDLGKDTLVCSKDQPIYLAAQEGFEHYTWSSGETSRVIKVDKAGQYIVKADFGCGTLSDTIFVKAYSYKKNQLQIGDTYLKCPSEFISVKATLNHTGYKWNSGISGPELITNIPGLYEVSAISAEGCIVKDSVEIKNIQAISPFSLGNDTIICAQKELVLQTNQPEASVMWSNGSQDNSLQIKNAGVYVVKIYNRCFQVSDTISVSVKDCSSLFIPNIFTPNNDGVNDFFHIITEDNRLINLKIFNRWGNLLLDKENYTGNWNAENIPDGLYYYTIIDHQYQKDYKGWVQVLR